MASFQLADIDYDQSGFGELHAVPELKAQLPRTARIARRIPGPDRDDYFSAIFTRPVKYHPSAQFVWERTQPEFAIVIASLQAGTRIHAGMKNFPEYVAYSVDNTVGLNEQLDFAKCDSIGWGTIHAIDDPQDTASRSD